jgi:hypothetical protein
MFGDLGERRAVLQGERGGGGERVGHRGKRGAVIAHPEPFSMRHTSRRQPRAMLWKEPTSATYDSTRTAVPSPASPA